MKTYQPEKLSMWDRFFNRTKKIAVEQGTENWSQASPYFQNYKREYSRNYVIYHIIDRLTGGFTIEKEYLE